MEAEFRRGLVKLTFFSLLRNLCVI